MLQAHLDEIPKKNYILNKLKHTDNMFIFNNKPGETFTFRKSRRYKHLEEKVLKGSSTIFMNGLVMNIRLDELISNN